MSVAVELKWDQDFTHSVFRDNALYQNYMYFANPWLDFYQATSSVVPKDFWSSPFWQAVLTQTLQTAA